MGSYMFIPLIAFCESLTLMLNSSEFSISIGGGSRNRPEPCWNCGIDVPYIWSVGGLQSFRQSPWRAQDSSSSRCLLGWSSHFISRWSHVTLVMDWGLEIQRDSIFRTNFWYSWKLAGRSTVPQRKLTRVALCVNHSPPEVSKHETIGRVAWASRLVTTQWFPSGGAIAICLSTNRCSPESVRKMVGLSRTMGPLHAAVLRQTPGSRTMGESHQ